MFKVLNSKLITKILNRIERNKVIVFVLLIGASLRFIGIYPGFPYYHSDEPMIYRNAAKIIVSQKFLPDVYAYPTFLPFFHAALYLLFFIPITMIQTFFTGHSFLEYSSLSQYFNNAIFGYREINALFWSRYINAFLGVVSIYTVFYVAKRIFNKTVGILTATLLAFNYRHVLGSHYALPDVANGLFFLLSLLAAIQIMDSNSRKTYIIAGIISGLSVSIKYSPFGLLMCLMAHMLKIRKRNRYWSNLMVLIILFITTLFIVNPFHFFNHDETVKYLEYLNYKYNVGTLTFLPYPYVYLYRHGIGQIITVMILFGIILGLKSKFRYTLLMLVPIVLIFYYLTVYSEGGIYVRNFVAVIPLLLIFASLGFENLFSYLAKKFKNRGILISIIFFSLALITPIYNSILVPWEYTKKWNLTSASESKTELLGKKVAGNSWFLDQIFNKGEIHKTDFNIRTSFTFAELQEAGVEYLVLDSESNENYFTWWMKSKSLDVFFKKRKSIMLKTFPGGAIAELVSRRDRDFSKSWQAYENSVFFIPIPRKFNQFDTQVILDKNFDENNVTNLATGMEDVAQNIFNDQKCIKKGCLKVGTSLQKNSEYRMFGNIMLVDPLIVQPNYLYKVNIKIKPVEELTNKLPDGVIKTELYKNNDDLYSGKSGTIIFYSTRYQPEQTGWQEKEIIVDIPPDYRWMKLSLQIYENASNQFYIDDLKIERSVQLFPNFVNRKNFPEDAVFIKSII